MDPWRFDFDSKTKTVSGVKYEWCAHNGHKNDKGNQSGMYMEAPHYHPQWIKNKEEKHSVWKAKVDERKKPDQGGNTKSTENCLSPRASNPPTQPTSNSPIRKMNLSRRRLGEKITRKWEKSRSGCG